MELRENWFVFDPKIAWRAVGRWEDLVSKGRGAKPSHAYQFSFDFASLSSFLSAIDPPKWRRSRTIPAEPRHD
jgi:hypothetical protein